MNRFLAGAPLVFDPILPVPLIALLALVLLGLTLAVYLRVGSRLKPWQSFILLLLRLLGLVGLMLLLLQPSRVEVIPPPPIQPVTLLALDTSRSMKQADVDKVSRLEAAKNLLVEAELASRDGRSSRPGLRLFQFSEDSTPMTGSLFDLSAKGATTRFHRSVLSLLNSLASTDDAKAIILLTDGHDFELVNPTKTGFIVRSRKVPIYAVPLGKKGMARDVSVRIANYQPYCYVKQKARISGLLRLVGSEYEDLQIQLLRQNKVVQTQRLNAAEEQQIPIQFEVSEPATGQFEYEIRVLPLEGEVDTNNNAAITYLNVIDQQIRVLLMEGSPYWDTTFLQRSLLRNDKVSLDAIIQYARRKFRFIRKEGTAGALQVPSTAEQLNQYDVIILGRSLDQLISRQQLELLTDFVKNRGGSLIFSRGRAFDNELAENELEPVIWADAVNERLRLQVAREGQALAPFRILGEQAGGADAVPELLAGQQIKEQKPLAATLAAAQGQEDGAILPAVVHRRFGQGQLLSVGVTGLWRWAFNAKIEGVNTLFDRFWDQMILWLLASQDTIPSRRFSFRTSSANILLGEKVYFRLVARNVAPNPPAVPLTLYQEDKPIGRTVFAAPLGQDAYRQTAEFLPEKVGRYRAAATFPDGTKQESRFMVYDENLEETEVATDTVYLKKLCEASGGCLLKPNELAGLIQKISQERVEATPKTKLTSVWDQTWLFYLLGLSFAADWYLRRRWGLC